jgi:hypothetical protein
MPFLDLLPGLKARDSLGGRGHAASVRVGSRPGVIRARPYHEDGRVEDGRALYFTFKRRDWL